MEGQDNGFQWSNLIWGGEPELGPTYNSKRVNFLNSFRVRIIPQNVKIILPRWMEWKGFNLVTQFPNPGKGMGKFSERNWEPRRELWNLKS